MFNFFNKKRVLSVFILVLCVFLLVGCGKKQSRKLWDAYVDAVNSQDIQAVAKTFYIDQLNGSENVNYVNFIDNNNDYFGNITSLKTVSYEEDINCDFSNATNVQAYYGAKVTVLVNGSNEYDLYIYSYSDSTGTFFCSEFKIDGESKGNQPSKYWKEKVYYVNKDYKYFINDKNQATYIEKVSNDKNVVVPETVDNASIKTIGEYAFYKYNKILCFTIPTSKMKSIDIAEGVETIGKYSFYQCKNLAEITIPESINLIDKMAFASCTGLKSLEFQARTEVANNAQLTSVPSKKDDTAINIVGAHNLQTGEIVTLKIDDELKVAKWSVNASNVLKIDENTGRVIALSVGEATVTATLKDDPTNYASVKIQVSETPATLTIANDAFNRCNNLEAIYFHATNPNSISIVNGTSFTFNKSCKIYVPYGSKDMYVNHALWSAHAEQIVEMEKTEEQMYLNDAKNAYTAAVGSEATLNGVYAYNNPINVDNVLYLFNYTVGSETKNLVIDLYTGSFLVNNRTTKVLKLEDLSSEELFNSVFLGTEKYGTITLETVYDAKKNASYEKAVFDYTKPIILESNAEIKEDEFTFESSKVTFEDQIVEVTSDGLVICSVNAIVSYKNVGVYSDSVVVIFDTVNNTYKVASLEGTTNDANALFDALIKILLTGKKLA